MITILARRYEVVDPSLSGPVRPVQAAIRLAKKWPARRVPVGLGDAIERVAKPIARWIDRRTARLGPRWRTKIAGCSACSRRRELLNWIVRDVRSWAAWRRSWREIRPAWRRFYGVRSRAP